MITHDAWLKCKVQKGMFSDEKVIQVRLKTAESTSFTVSTRHLEETAGDKGRVKVRFVGKKQSSLVVIPSFQPEIVAIDESELEPA